MGHLAVTAIGADRPGIVADVTGALSASGCNLADSTMSILGGHFAMVLVVDSPEGVDAQVLQADLAGVAGLSDLVVSVRDVVDPVGSASRDGERWTVVVHGADHAGIVHGISSVLAGLDVNIVDLTTRVTGSPPMYAMVIEVAVPPGLDARDLDRRLSAAADELGVGCSLHPSEADIL